MSSLYQGQNKIALSILLSITIGPLAFFMWLMSGYANLAGGMIWGFGVMIYIFVINYLSVKLPEKHRKEVQGKNFLDIEIYRNKEESQSYFIGVPFNEELKTSEVEAQAIESDPKYISIKQSCTIETEKGLLNYELERRERKELFEDANLESVEDTLESDPKEAYETIKEMEEKIIEEVTRHVDESLEKINENFKKIGETIDSLKEKADTIESEEILQQLDEVKKIEEMRPKYSPPEKNMTEMTYPEIQMRILSLDECEQNMFNLSYDDFMHVMQYRLFQVRRIFKKLFSEDVHIEVVKSYQPVVYFDTGVEFERFILVMRRPYIKEFSFKQMQADHEGYSVTVQSAKCTAVTCGWANSKIPIFLVIHSPADAYEKMDVVYDAKQLVSLKERILARMVNWYRMEYEQSDYALEEERAFANLFITKYDELKQKLEEIDYEPDTSEFITNERVVKIVPTGIKIYSVVATMLYIIFIITTIIAGSLLRISMS